MRPRAQDYLAPASQAPMEGDAEDHANGIVICSLKDVVSGTLPGVLNSLDIPLQGYKVPWDIQ